MIPYLEGGGRPRASSPSVVAVHVFLKPVLEVSQLMLHTVHHLHGRVQIPAAQAVVDDGPDWVALDVTVLERTRTHTQRNWLQLCDCGLSAD